VRVLLLGAFGRLGSEIRERWNDVEIVAPSHAELDIENRSATVQLFDRVAPDMAVNCTAFHDVDRCEREPDRAFALNALAVDRVARLCRDRNATFVTLSTDYVFDGGKRRSYVEDDVACPISAYGVSKRAGELLVERLEMRSFIVRTCGIYGRSGDARGSFPDRIIAAARAGEPIRVVSDVVASPTYAGHLATALRALAATDRYGIYHVANRGAISWYDFAVETLRRAGIDYPIEPIHQLNWKTEARRPHYSALASRRLRALGIAMPGWQEGLAEYLASERVSPLE
jgi:dTDP-4-dehydrorhamnose reductase